MLTVKISLAAALFALSLPATAACIYIAEVSTKILYLEISDGGCAGELTIEFARNIGVNGKPVSGSISRFPFDKECIVTRDKDGHAIGLSCHPNGNTPLAGATYKLKRIGSKFDECGDENSMKIPAFKYVCVQGCSVSAPRILDKRNICD